MAYNYYKILGISEKSGVPEIKRAYRDLAKKYHPDRNTNGSGEYFIVLNEAYQVLCDPVKRRFHDELLGLVPPQIFTFNEIPITKSEKRAERRRNKKKDMIYQETRKESIWDPPKWVKIALYFTGLFFGISVTIFTFYFIGSGVWPLFMMWVSFLGIIVLLDSFSGLVYGNTLLTTRLALKIRSWFF